MAAWLKMRFFMLFFLLILRLPGLGAQAPAASAASAQGWEGLLYNPAVIGFHNYQALALGGSFSTPTDFGLSFTLLDNLLLRYRVQEGREDLSFAGGLSFPLFGRLYAGMSAEADLLQWGGEKLFLSTGLLYLPHRYIALGASQQNLLDLANSTYTFGAAVRPFTERLTVFGDLILPYSSPLERWDVAAGLRAAIVEGIELGFRTDGRFSNFLVEANLHAGPTRFSVRLAGDYRFSLYSVGAELGYSALPARSVLNPRPKHYLLKLSRKLDGNSIKKESLYTAESLVSRIYRLAEEPACRTLVLRFDSTIISSIEVLEELKDAFAYFKSRGKQIITFIDNSYSQLDYLAAAAGTRVVLSPNSVILLLGVGAEFLFYKNLLDHLGIEVDYARSSEYKSALDSFLRESLSEENRGQITAYLSTAYTLIQDILVSSRGIPEDRARQLIDRGPYLAEEAVGLGLADEVMYFEEFEEKYSKDGPAASLAYIAYQERSWRRPVIGVVKATGFIISSQALTPWDRLIGGSFITEKSLVPVLEALKRDTDVAAVVLQIDSPGGDGLTSDRIWKAIVELKKKKPVAIVMGGTAASGGYYLSMAGEPVFAHRTSLTGSIGAFTYKPSFDRLLERYGITTDAIKLGKSFDFFSPFHPLTEEQREKLRSLNDAFVDQFYRKVSAARSLPLEEVQRLGGGRIYSGERALELKLVDRIGGIREALGYLEARLGLGPEDYRLVYLPDWEMSLRLALEGLNEEGVSLPRLLSAFLFR